MTTERGYTGWALVEVMGHRRIAGHVSEATIAGAPMLRVDVPGPSDGDPVKATQFYGGASIFCLTPITQKAARKEANPPAWAPPEPLQLRANFVREGNDPEDEESNRDEEEEA